MALGHDQDCICAACMVEDMDAHLASQGVEITWGAGEIAGSVASVRTRYATPGTACGTGVVRLVSPKQVKYIKFLLSSRDTTRLVRLPGSEDVEHMSLAGARDLIDRLLACPERPAYTPTATGSQLSFIRLLCARKGMTDLSGDVHTRQQASRTIEMLKALPDTPRPAAKERAELEAGIYLVNGKVHKVQRAVHGSGNLYAKILDIGTGRFEYAPGAIRQIRPEHRMSLEQAKEFGALYGVCCSCGATLTDETSIEAGIGPVCARKFA
jgi:hypothetical protein